MPPETRPCVFCAYPIPTLSDSGDEQTEQHSPACPVCLDGEQDPWAIIRAIRAQFLGVAEVLEAKPEPLSEEAVNIFETDFTVLRATADALWPRLSLSASDDSIDESTITGQLQLSYGYEEGAARHLTERFLKLHEDFHGQWTLVAESSARRWPRLSPPDLDRIERTVGGLAGLIAERYNVSTRNARKDVMDLLDDLHFSELIQLPSPTGGHSERAEIATDVDLLGAD